MLDKTGLKNALARFAAGIVFLSAYIFMLSEISTLVNQVIVWVTGIVFALYGFMRYRELQTVKKGPSEQPETQKQKWPFLEAAKIPLLGILIIALYYLVNPVLALVFFLFAGLWLSFNGLVRCITLFVQKFAGKSGQETNVIHILIIATILIVLDVFVFGSFYIAGILLLIVIPQNIFKAMGLRADRPIFKQQILSAGVYAIAAVLIITAFNWNNDLAERRLIIIATACEQYKQKYGEYPAELPKLIPEFIDKIPAAKIGFPQGDFRYIAGKDRHKIMYVKIPPFGRPYYVLETKQWGFSD